jgi:basic membrane lipoprotein Med (substrate-binding protein (PBP1-ABC) superfamily)
MRTKLIAAAVAVIVLISGIVAFFVLRDDEGDDKPPLPVARNASLNPVVCAAIGTDDPTGTATSDSAWQALLDAAATDKLNAQRLPVTATSPADAETYLAGLVARKCRVVVATGPHVTAAARAMAARGTDIQWAITDPGQPAPRITVLSTDPPTTRTQVRELVRATVGR